MNDAKHIPALGCNRLTYLYDSVIGLTLPETKFKTALLAQADIHSGHRVLDFGVGTATLSLLAKQKHPEAEFTGADVDEKVLAIAKRKIEQAGADIALIHYNGRTLPFADASFNRVISTLVFHHLLSAQKLNCLKEIHRVLKPDGELHIADWGMPSNIMMRAAFCLVQILDGFPNTQDHADGKFPAFITQAGFSNVEQGIYFNTVFGTLQLFKAKKPSMSHEL